MGEGPQGNMSFSLQETDPSGGVVTYEELLEEVDLMEVAADVSMDSYIAQEIDYQTNYLRKDLDRIAEYYGISRRKKRKPQLAEDIVIFEQDPTNEKNVYRRKRLLSHILEIKADKYLSKYLILD